MTTGWSRAADACLFTSLTALSASWPRREAGRCFGRHQRARCTANPRVVGNVLSHSGQLCGRSRALSSTSFDTGRCSRTCTCMPIDLGSEASVVAAQSHTSNALTPVIIPKPLFSSRECINLLLFAVLAQSVAAKYDRSCCGSDESLAIQPWPHCYRCRGFIQHTHARGSVFVIVFVCFSRIKKNTVCVILCITTHLNNFFRRRNVR